MKHDLVFVEPQGQRVWGWPAVLNFGLGGTGAAFFLLQWIERSADSWRAPERSLWLAPFLIALGFCSLSFEAGKPWRARFALRNLRRSWMSREVLAAVLFVPAALWTAVSPDPVGLGLAVTAAIGFVVSQSMILYRARGVPAWNTPMLPVLFATAAFASAAGLQVLGSAAAGPGLVSHAILTTTLIAGGADVIAWLLYLHGSDGRNFQEATARLRSGFALLAVPIVSRLVPVLMLWVFVPDRVAVHGEHIWRWMAALLGLVLFTGGLVERALVLLRAAMLIPPALRVVPAPARVVAERPLVLGDERAAGLPHLFAGNEFQPNEHGLTLRKGEQA